MNSYFFTIAIQNPGSGSLKYCRVFLVCNEWHEPEVPKVLHLRNHVTHLKIKYYSTNVLAKFQNRRSPSHFFHLSIFWRLRWIIINNAFIFLVKTERTRGRERGYFQRERKVLSVSRLRSPFRVYKYDTIWEKKTEEEQEEERECQAASQRSV